MLKKIAILGSTGSIGKNTLAVAAHLKEKIKVVALAAKSNIDLLEAQAHQFQPQLIAVEDKDKALLLQKRLPQIPVLGGIDGICAVAAFKDADLIVSALVGAAGLLPTAEAIKANKKVALANKEVLVAAGAYIMPLSKLHGVPLIPIDSEHNAIFQCLNQEDPTTIRRLILTGSGGPFRDWTAEQLARVSPEQALKHPNFEMGPKITVDSSTLMNKGLEVIEAYWLFGISVDQIEVLIHPQQKIHSMVEYIDGSIIAQISEPSMLLPIQYALTYPKRCPGVLKPFDWVSNHRLDFLYPNRSAFRCLDLAYLAIKEGGTLPCYMNAVNEVLVGRFLSREIGWLDISIKLEAMMSSYPNSHTVDLSSILEVDQMAREQALFY
jgi:1-deoxy-D-xylulose-5-phosphate reductoisomerase